MKAHTRIIIGLLAIGVATSSYINIHVDQPGHKVSPELWGIFIEEISHAGDGGLYGELIKNRALAPKLPDGDLDGYDMVKSNGVDGQISISRDNTLNDVLNTSLRLDVTTDVSNEQRIGISNSGYWGIPIRPDYTQYRASFYAKASGSFRGPLIVSLESTDGSVVYASAQIDEITDQFQKYEVVLTPSPDLIQQPSLDNLFIIATSGDVPNGTSIFFNLVSLFPPTFKNRPNGMRIDIAQILADAKPKFHRFPGGNFLEGDTISKRFIWEETIGDISQRPGHQGCWGYYSSDGLGLLEYAQFTEDIGATLILGVFAGYALNGETTRPENLGPYIESALNEIEYLIGDANTTWGARRIADGREEPFDLKYVEIGNEDYFSKDYADRYPPFYNAISEKYPQLEIIATARVEGTGPIQIVDDHYYEELGWCPDNHRHYDNTSRDGPKIFVGEFACKDNTLPKSYPTVAAAIDNAAWMTGLERNSDIVILACYAPLLGNVNDPAGTTDAIYYNGVVAYETPIWWVFNLFGNHQGDTFVPSDSDANNGRPNEKIFHVASLDTNRNVLIVKIVNTFGEDIMIDTVELQGIDEVRNGTYTILTGGKWDMNDVDNPKRISPETKDYNINGNSFSFNAPAFSLNVFEFQL